MTSLRLDPEKRLLFFDGDCDQAVSLCKAMCCRQWNVLLSRQEHETGIYDSEIICAVNSEACVKAADTCFSKRYRIKRRGNGACVHLAQDNKCAIYEKRPKVCRDFLCRGGWQLQSVAPAVHTGTDKAHYPAFDDTSGIMTGGLVLEQNPVLGLKTVFYDTAAGELIFVCSHLGKCSFVTGKCVFPSLPVRDEDVLALVKLFDGKSTLDTVCAAFAAFCAPACTHDDMLVLVKILIAQNILIMRYTSGQ